MTTALFVPADQAERDFIRDRVDLNLCVEAGAGTGKTTVLVDRIVRVLARGHATARDLAVITFTEKAAAELSGRVREGLEAARAATTDAGERRRLDDALAELTLAHIETIHAFAAGILRERPVEAQLDPGFEVLDELPARLDFEQAYDDWITAEMAADEPPRALLNAMDLDLGFERVREAAELLHRHRELLPLAGYATEPIDAAAVRAELSATADEMRALRDCIKPGWESDAAYQELLRSIGIEELLAAYQEDAVLRRGIVTARAPRSNRGQQDHWRDRADCRRAKKLIDDFARALNDAREAMRQAATADVVAWLQGFVEWHARQRRAEGTAGFDDLLIWARDLVRDDAEVCRYFQQKFRCVLVDEFQDTDPIQAELIVRLCADGIVEGDWRRARLRPGSLFVVGDPKQSVYRFRRADIAMYDDVKTRVFGGAVRYIRQNFRSVRPIIEWANDVFGQLFEGRTGVQPAYVPLAHHPLFEARSAVTVLRDVLDLNPTDTRKREGELLASLIRERVEGGEWTVRDRDGSLRPARYRDVAVLIPMRTELEHYEDAFSRAGLPYRHEGGRTFFARQEVRELVALLRAIDDPADGVAAVAALRSPAFGCSDEELLLHRAAGWRFDHAAVPAQAEGVVAESLGVLHELSDLRHRVPLPDLVRAVLDRTRLVEFAMLQPQGEQHAANLLKIIDQARTFAEASGRGLRGFVRWLRDNADQRSDETDAPISEETDDVLRIITVHAAKGLEFPVVVFANMHTARRDWTNVIPDADARLLHIKLGRREHGFRTPGYDDAEEREKQHRSAEDVRLLYVAATRARDLLVVPFVGGSGDARKESSLNDVLTRAGAAAGDALDIATLPAVEGELPVWRREHASAGELEVERTLDARARWRAERAGALATAAAPRTLHTASALKPEWEREIAGGDEVRRGRATDFGSAVHAVIERARLDGGAPIDMLASAAAAQFGQLGREDEIAAVTRSALASAAVARARASKRALQEVAFTAPAPASDTLAEGRMDLLFEEDGALVVVDFKTDAVSAREVAERAAFYRSQALVYAWAAQACTGMPVREVVFVFARPGIEQTIAVDHAFLREAEELLRQPVTSAEETAV